MPNKLIERLIDMPRVDSVAVSPLTGELAFSWNVDGQPTLYRLPPHGGASARAVASNGHHPTWSADGAQLLFLRDAGGREQDDLWLLDIKSEVPRALITDEAGYSWPRFSSRGALAVLSNRDGEVDPYLVDRSSGGVRRLVEGASPASSLAWSPDGCYLGYLRLASDASRAAADLCVWEAEQRAERVVSRLEGDLFHAAWSWRPGARYGLTVPADHGDRVLLCDLALDGPQQWLAPADGDLWQPRWSPDGQWIAFIQEARAQRALVAWRPATDELRSLSVAPGLHRDFEWAPDGRSLNVLFESAVRPASLWRVPLGEGAPRALLPDPTAELPAGTLTPSRFISYESFDGLEIPGLFYESARPNGTAVVWVHGGPAGQHADGWYPEIQLLTAAGYSVLAPNMRGSSGFGKRFRDLSRFDWGGGELADLAHAQRWLRRAGYERVAILGQSLGGYLALMALTHQPDLWAAGMLFFPIADLERLYHDTRADLRRYLVSHIGTPEQRPEWFRERSPIHALDRLRAPLLLLHGENDPRVPLAESESIQRELHTRGRWVRLRRYSGEGHGFRARKTRLNAAQELVGFLDSQIPRA